MIISHNSQLGLRFKERDIKVDLLRLIKSFYEKSAHNAQVELDVIRDEIDVMKEYELSLSECEKNGEVIDPILAAKAELIVSKRRNTIRKHSDSGKIRAKMKEVVDVQELVMKETGAYYLICDSIYQASALIRIGEGFTGRTLKDINFGKYTYLMGKHRMVRFECVIGGIFGFFYDETLRIAFEFSVDIETGAYDFPEEYSTEFSSTMQVLAFVELGDIEVVMLEGGRNNGRVKSDGKITNTSEKTVYVVDSTWNKIMIRTDGFAVRGHFRLQPCGHNMADRKLIWIDAFEKHGYTRRPTAEIVR